MVYRTAPYLMTLTPNLMMMMMMMMMLMMTGMLDVCCDTSAPAKSWCKKYCEISHSHLLGYCQQSDSDAMAQFKLLLRDTPVYVGDKAFTLIHNGEQYAFRVRS